MLTSFFIILVELALHTFLLLGQLDFCTYALFGTLKTHYECGLVARALDSGSDVRGFNPITDDIFSLCQDIFFLITIFMIFSPS